MRDPRNFTDRQLVKELLARMRLEGACHRMKLGKADELDLLLRELDRRWNDGLAWHRQEEQQTARRMSFTA